MVQAIPMQQIQANNMPATATATMAATQRPATATCNCEGEDMEAMITGFMRRKKTLQVLQIIFFSLLILVAWRQLRN